MNKTKKITVIKTIRPAAQLRTTATVKGIWAEIISSVIQST